MHIHNHTRTQQQILRSVTQDPDTGCWIWRRQISNAGYGRIYLVEYRGEDRRIPIKPLHKMTQQQAIREMQSVGLRWIGTKDFLPTQHFMIFEKPGET